jgi:hypothetical protein
MWPLSALADWPSSLRDCSESPVSALRVEGRFQTNTRLQSVKV